MPKLSALTENNVIKMLLIGDSGNGKTGALASLALAGYKVRILDFDKGIEPVRAAIIKAGKPAALDLVECEALDDKYQIVGGNVIPVGIPSSFQNGLKMLDKWGPMSMAGATDLGPPSAWGRDCVLVIDSLTHLCNSAMRYVQAVAGHSGQNPTQPEWGTAQRMVEQMLGLLYSDQFHTNVIVTAHITYVSGKEKYDDDGKADGQIRGLPNALGAALPPKIPSYFNHMLIVERKGMGTHTKRVISTVPSMMIAAKSPILYGIPAELPVETGLADYFSVALGKTKEVTAVLPASATKP